MGTGLSDSVNMVAHTHENISEAEALAKLASNSGYDWAPALVGKCPFTPEMQNPHPAPFPLALPVRCIQAVMSEPGVVLDPYNGSGTTGVAATLAGHDYIGFDLSEEYLKMAEDRISNISDRDLKKYNEFSLVQRATNSLWAQLVEE